MTSISLIQNVSCDEHCPVASLPEGTCNAIQSFFPQTWSQLEVEPLKEGSVYKITDPCQGPSAISVVRSCFPSWSAERCERETEIAYWIANAQAGPQVLGVSPDSRVTRLEYFSGGTLNPNASLPLSLIADCLRKLHSVGLPPQIRGEQESTSFARMHRQYKQVCDLYGSLPEAIGRMYASICDLEAMLDTYSTKALCHLDLHCHNIMWHEGSLYAIDYGMAGPDHPYFDLANVAMYLDLQEHEELTLLYKYEEGAVPERKLKEYGYFRPLAYVGKIMWGLIRAHKEGATAEMIEQVWAEDEVMPIAECFSWIYSGKDRTALEDLRYARSAYERFCQKSRDYQDLR